MHFPDSDEAKRILGVSPDAAQKEIKQAYRDLIKVWYPNRFGDDQRLRTTAEEKLKRINSAYEQLVLGVLEQCSEASAGLAPDPRHNNVQPESQSRKKHTFTTEDKRFQKDAATETSNANGKVFLFLMSCLIASLILIAIRKSPKQDATTESSTPVAASGALQPKNSSPENTKETMLSLVDGDDKPRLAGFFAITDPSISQADNERLRRKFFDDIIVLTSSERLLDHADLERDLFLDTTDPPESPGHRVQHPSDFDGTRNEWLSHAKERNSSGLSAAAMEQLIDMLVDRAHLYFTMGSTTDEVLRVQGPPTQIEDEIGDPTVKVWRYGPNSVRFKNGRVIGWYDYPTLTSILKPLRVKMRPSEPRAAKPFKVGSTKDEVFFAQGPPDTFSEHTWKYGNSSVSFDRGLVSGWVDSPNSPLKHVKPQESTKK